MTLTLRLEELASGLSVCIVLILVTLQLEWLTSLEEDNGIKEQLLVSQAAGTVSNCLPY